MTSNDILRRLRHALLHQQRQMVEMFAKEQPDRRHAQLHSWLLKEAAEGEERDPGFVPCPDSALSQFLDGFIAVRLRVREDVRPQVILRTGSATTRSCTRAAHRPRPREEDMLEHPQARQLQPLQSPGAERPVPRQDHKHHRDLGIRSLAQLPHRPHRQVQVRTEPAARTSPPAGAPEPWAAHRRPSHSRLQAAGRAGHPLFPLAR